jgi:hypothetical protein
MEGESKTKNISLSLPIVPAVPVGISLERYEREKQFREADPPWAASIAEMA